MSTTNKMIAGVVIGAGALAVVSYLRNIERAQANLEVIPTVNIHKLSLEGLTLRIDALLKNPTGVGFGIKYPFIKLSYGDASLGSSQSIDKNIHIPAYGQVRIDDIMVTIPTLSFFSVSYDMIKALLNNQPVTITISVTTTADLGWTKVNVEHKQDMTIKK